MFFIAAKIVWILLSPLSLVLALFILGAFSIILSLSRAGIFFIFTGMVIFIALGLLPVGHNLMAGLENQYVRPDKMPSKVSGIVVLGGSFETQISEKRGYPVVNAKIERVLEGLRLAKAYPDAKLIFSGGEGSLLHQDHPESKDVALFIKNYDFDVPQHIAYEMKSRNTLENLEFTHVLAAPKPGEKWLLVTSAWHMKRAMEAAREAGWKDIIPFPVGYQTDGAVADVSQMLNVPRNFYLADLALHEYAGMLAYNLREKFSGK
jgi:uncharacterized SAM-binding protein YcdF (DUF218 family)